MKTHQPGKEKKPDNLMSKFRYSKLSIHIFKYKSILSFLPFQKPYCCCHLTAQEPSMEGFLAHHQKLMFDV